MTLRGGRYELLDTIASGGMATVHLARTVGAGGFERLVAIKTMHPHLSSEPEFVSMFLDEARIAARIRHPNVVATIDFQQDEIGLFLVMEYIEGPSMSQVLRALAKQKATLPIDMTLRIMLDTLAGLHAAHELCGPTGEPLHVVHRDISPHNILVGVDGIARIMDFGVARAEARMSSTRAGDVKSKITYMAPEQARMDNMDRRVDVYAAGVVLWEFLTGRRLIRGDNDLVVMNQIFNATHPAPHDVIESIPYDLSDVVMRAIARDRRDRHPTAAAFAEALDRVVRTNGLSVATPRAVGTLVRELQVHKTPVDFPSGSRPLPSIPPAQTRSGVSGSTAPSALVEAASASTTNASTGTRGAFASTPSEAASRAPARRKIIAAVAGATLAGGMLGWFVLSSPSSKDKPVVLGAAPSSDTSTTAGPDSSATVATAPVAALPSAAAAPTTSATTGSTSRTPNTNPGGPKSAKQYIPKEL